MNFFSLGILVFILSICNIAAVYFFRVISYNFSVP